MNTQICGHLSASELGDSSFIVYLNRNSHDNITVISHTIDRDEGDAFLSSSPMTSPESCISFSFWSSEMLSYKTQMKKVSRLINEHRLQFSLSIYHSQKPWLHHGKEFSPQGMPQLSPDDKSTRKMTRGLLGDTVTS